MILLSDCFSAEEFIADLFTSRSFCVKPGRMCWDCEGWVVVSEFRAKWSFLFM